MWSWERKAIPSREIIFLNKEEKKLLLYEVKTVNVLNRKK